MQREVDEICGWSPITTKKTKEMLLGSVTKDPPPLIMINNSPVERVQPFKFLDWNEHITEVCTKASKRLYFMKLLKHVTEYACAVW